MPTANVMYGAERAVLPRGPGDRAAELTDLRREQGGSRFAGRGVDEGVDFLRRQVAEQHAVAVAGGVVGIHVPMTERDHRHGGERVDVRPESAERRVGAVSLVAEVHGLDHDERPPAEELGDLRERWDIEHPAHGDDLIGLLLLRPFAPRLKHLAHVLLRPEHRAGIRDGPPIELDRGADSEAAAPATQCPEQVRMLLTIGAHVSAVGRHQLDGGDARWPPGRGAARAS